MIETVELLRILYRHDVLHILDYTDHGAVATWIGAYSADVIIGEVMAYLAIFHVMSDPYYGIGKAVHIGSRLSEQMQNKA